jgi:protease II
VAASRRHAKVEDVGVFVEADARYEVTVRTRTNEDLILIESECRDTTETWFVRATDPTAAPPVVQPRRAASDYR